MSYDPDARVHHAGTMTGGDAFEPAFNAEIPSVLPVQRMGVVPRDALAVRALCRRTPHR